MTNPDSLLAHAGFVRAIARSLVSDEARVDDIVQETWLAALKNPPRHRRSIRAWLGTIALNVARSTLRSDIRRAKREHRVAREESLPSTADIADSRSMMRYVVEAVYELDEPYASTVILRYYEDLSPSEIAKQQDVPVETVRTRLKRANHRMRKFLDTKFGGDRRAWSLSLIPFLRPGSTSVAVGSGAIAASASALMRVLAIKGWGKAIIGLLLLIALFLAGLQLFKSPEEGTAAISSRVGGGTRVDSSTPRLPAFTADSRPPSTSSDADLAGLPGEIDLDLPGSLEVTVVWKDTNEPAVGIRAAVGGADLVNVLGNPLAHVTDDGGRFEIDVIPPGMAIVHFDRIPGFGYSEIRPGERSELTVAVPPGADLHGTVLDSTGRPIEDAEIYLCREPWDPGAVLARTDANGEYRIRAVSVGGFIGARAYGYTPAPTRFLPTKTVRELEFGFRLAPSFGAVSGTVTGPDGSPIEGASISIGTLDNGEASRLADGSRIFAPPPIRLASSAGGEFEYSGFAEGRYLMSVTAPDLQRWTGEVDLTERDFAEVEVRLVRGTVLRGIVKDSRGQPVPNARIHARVEGEGPDAGVSTESDVSGEYRFESLMSGEVELRADGGNNRGIATTTLKVESEEELTWDPVLDTGLGIRGIVTDEEGNPLADYDVFAGIPTYDLDRFQLSATMHDFSWLRREGASEGYFEFDQMRESLLRRFRRAATTDATGRFLIANCDERSYPIEVFDPDRPSNQPCAWRDGVRPGGGDVLLVVRDTMRPSSYVTGKIVGPDDGPVPGVIVRLRSPDRHYWRAEAETRRDGSFRVGPLTSVDYYLCLESDDYGRRAVDTVRPVPGEDLDVGVIRLRGPGTLEAKLFRSDGEPIGTPRVWLFDETRTISVAVTLEEDIVRSGELAPGRYLLCVHGQGNSQVAWIECPLEIRPGQHTSEAVEVHSGVLRTVRILPVEGHPTIEGKVEVNIWNDAGERIACRRFRRTSGAESLSLDVVLDPGSYRLRVHAEGGVHAEHRLDIPATAVESVKTIDVRLTDHPERD